MNRPDVGPELSAPPAPQTPAPAPPDPAPSTADRKLRIINLAAVLVPVAGLGAAMLISWGDWFDWLQLSVMTGMSLATAIGITVGFHRLATHSSFRTPGLVRFILAALGSMAVQGPVIQWAGTHR